MIGYVDKLSILNKVFTPSTPIENRKAFAGRTEQLSRCLEVIYQPGSHAILYGERGVGKTSIANILRLILADRGLLVVKCSCSSEDTYASLWQKAFQHVSLGIEARSMGFQEAPRSTGSVTLAQFIEEYSVGNVITTLARVGMPVVVIFDEFDRLGANFDRRLLADTIKNISDEALSITLLIVGVADDVSQLLGEHASIERNLKQIHLPIMDDDELQEIINKGLSELDMDLEDDIADKVVRFSCGYPHYTHLLSYHACRAALAQARDRIIETDFDDAVARSIDNASARLQNSFHVAVLATKTNIYREVLFACSIAPTDEKGTFQAMDLVEPLSKILGQSVSVNKFTYHLGKFCSEDRGRVLTQIGVPKRHRYRFSDPLMRSLVLLNLYNRIHASKSAQYEQLRLFIFGE